MRNSMYQGMKITINEKPTHFGDNICWSSLISIRIKRKSRKSKLHYSKSAPAIQ